MADVVYSKEQVELWQKNLEEIAQKPRTTFTKKQAVEELIETIEKALTTRSYDEVASGLKEWGLDISAGSLKQYVTRYRRSHSSKAAANGRKRPSKSKQKRSATGAASSSATEAGSTAATADVEKEQVAAKKSDLKKHSRFIEMDEDL
ncbi:MAG: hypothetical protein AAFQ63_23720 [Cyanobacteria bacterium J06621_11]